MSQNGHDSLRSQLLDAAGNRAPASATMEAPSGSSPMFGWLAPDGFSTVRLEAIQAICPHTQRPGDFIIVLGGSVSMQINGDDGKRLMKRLGWSEKASVARATQ